ncbi:hypothetical protein [Alloactinosynnema sp. L-07]|nr:hypothetical protein [Alloactinosynnema sp. L-07]
MRGLLLGGAPAVAITPVPAVAALATFPALTAALAARSALAAELPRTSRHQAFLPL